MTKVDNIKCPTQQRPFSGIQPSQTATKMDTQLTNAPTRSYTSHVRNANLSSVTAEQRMSRHIIVRSLKCSGALITSSTQFIKSHQ